MDKGMEKNIRDSLQNLEVTPPKGSWDAISNRLENKRRNRRLYFWILPFSAFLLLATTTLHIQNQQKSKNLVNASSPTPLNPEKEKALENSDELKDMAEPQENISIVSNKEEPQKFTKPSKSPSNLKRVAPSVRPQENSVAPENTSHSTKESHTESSEKITTTLNTRNEPFRISPKEFSWNENLKLEPLPLITPSPPSLDAFNSLSRYGLFIGVAYSPMWASSELVGPSDVPIQRTILQKNLIDQKIIDYDINQNTGHQLNLYLGKSLGRKWDVIVGASYNKWSGNLDMYLQNTYEVSTTFTREHVDEETIKTIVELTQDPNKNHSGLSLIINQNEGLVKGKPTDSISKNQPIKREITQTKTTISYEEVTIVENVEYQDTIESSFDYTYVEVPLLLRYKMGSGRLQAHITGGVSTQLFGKLKIHSDAVSQNMPSATSENTRTAFRQWNALLSIGLRYQITNSCFILASPYGRLGISNPDKTQRPSSYGFNLGLEFAF
jgi:hypothetical protein